MTISPWPEQRAEEAEALRGQLDAVTNELEIVSEAWIDAEFAAEDRGWLKLGSEMEQAFTRSGTARIVRNCRLMSVVSPLIKRGLTLRQAYVFGQGVEIAARDAEVNDVIQAFLDDPSNLNTFSSSQARETGERTLGTDGQTFHALPTSPLTGRVQVRVVPLDEITDIIKNPDDRDDDWFYLREFEVTAVEAGYAGTRTRWERRRAYHPALGYRPAVKPSAINGIPVDWYTPILHTPVNRIGGTKWGIPDAYSSLPWARAYEGFLTDWARLMKALSRFAWRLSGDRSDKALKAAEKLRGVLPHPEHGLRDGQPVGGVAVQGPGQSLEAIPKSGATVDSQSGKPLAAMVAAGLGVSVVNLLADPGTTGARAVAETLDKPTILEAGARRELWANTYTQILNYVVMQSVASPRGPLAGTVTRDEYGRVTIDLGPDQNGEDRDPTIEVNWPDLNEMDPLKLVQAIVAADGTDKLPGEVVARLLLAALPVRDVDEIIEAMKDAKGNWVDPGVQAAAEAIQRHRDGQGTGLEDTTPPPEDQPAAE